MKIMNVQSLMREMITREDIITRIRWKRIFSGKCCWTGKISTAQWRPRLLAVLRWDKVQYCRVKTSLTSDNFSYT